MHAEMQQLLFQKLVKVSQGINSSGCSKSLSSKAEQAYI